MISIIDLLKYKPLYPYPEKLVADVRSSDIPSITAQNIIFDILSMWFTNKCEAEIEGRLLIKYGPFIKEKSSSLDK